MLVPVSFSFLNRVRDAGFCSTIYRIAQCGTSTSWVKVSDTSRYVLYYFRVFLLHALSLFLFFISNYGDDFITAQRVHDAIAAAAAAAAGDGAAAPTTGR